MGKSNRRRKNKDYDIGESSPGTVGDSQGTLHERLGEGPTFDPRAEETASEAESDRYALDGQAADSERQTQNESPSSEEQNEDPNRTEQQTTEQSTRMKYAQRYGDSWPIDRQRRFLGEHDVSAKEMDWTLKE